MSPNFKTGPRNPHILVGVESKYGSRHCLLPDLPMSTLSPPSWLCLALISPPSWICCALISAPLPWHLADALSAFLTHCWEGAFETLRRETTCFRCKDEDPGRRKTTQGLTVSPIPTASLEPFFVPPQLLTVLLLSLSPIRCIMCIYLFLGTLFSSPC